MLLPARSRLAAAAAGLGDDQQVAGRLAGNLKVLDDHRLDARIPCSCCRQEPLCCKPLEGAHGVRLAAACLAKHEDSRGGAGQRGSHLGGAGRRIHLMVACPLSEAAAAAGADAAGDVADEHAPQVGPHAADVHHTGGRLGNRDSIVLPPRGVRREQRALAQADARVGQGVSAAVAAERHISRRRDVSSRR